MDQLRFDNLYDLQNFLRSRDLSFSKKIVNLIYENLNTKDESIPIVKFVIKEDNSSIELNLDRASFISALEENLENFIYHENYEECSKIKETINLLRNNN